MPLVAILALRNLFHDRLRLIATLIGVVFSIVLVTVQMGLYLGFGRMVTVVIDRASADLWIMTRGGTSFEGPSVLEMRDRERALAVKGVAEVTPVVTAFADWRLPTGALTPVFVVGTVLHTPGLQPWNVKEGQVEALAASGAVAVDRAYFDRLGVSRIGETAEIRQRPVHIVAITDGIRSFTTTPYIFMEIDSARRQTGIPSDKAAYFLVKLDPGADTESVRLELLKLIPKVEVLTSREFAERSRNFWLFSTGAGAALFAGALLGIIVGTVIVAQTLYASTKEHLNEFATLRAIGSSRTYIYTVIVCQAIVSAFIGFAVAALIGLGVVGFTAGSALPIVITGGVMAILFLLTIVMCVGSGIAAIIQVTRVDPASAFTR
jgi:putative ABC transport system permease protein